MGRKAEDGSAWSTILNEAMDKLQTPYADEEEEKNTKEDSVTPDFRDGHFVRSEVVMSYIRICLVQQLSMFNWEFKARLHFFDKTGLTTALVSETITSSSLPHFLAYLILSSNLPLHLPRYLLTSGFFPHPLLLQQLKLGLGHLIVEVPRSHSDAPHSVGLLCTSDQPVVETCT